MSCGSESAGAWQEPARARTRTCEDEAHYHQPTHQHAGMAQRHAAVGTELDDDAGQDSGGDGYLGALALQGWCEACGGEGRVSVRVSPTTQV